MYQKVKNFEVQYLWTNYQTSKSNLMFSNEFLLLCANENQTYPILTKPNFSQMRLCTIHLVMGNVPRWPQTNSLTHQTWPILCLRLIIVIRKIWNPGESVAYIKTRKMSLHRRQTKILLWQQKSASSSTSPLSLSSSSLSSTSGSVFLWASSWCWMQTKVPNSFTSRPWLIGLGQDWSRTQHADLGGVPSCHHAMKYQ